MNSPCDFYSLDAAHHARIDDERYHQPTDGLLPLVDHAPPRKVSVGFCQRTYPKHKRRWTRCPSLPSHTGSTPFHPIRVVPTVDPVRVDADQDLLMLPLSNRWASDEPSHRGTARRDPEDLITFLRKESATCLQALLGVSCMVSEAVQFRIN